MNEKLKRMEKDLRAFAKRTKSIKYTKGLLLNFLLTGMLFFSYGLTFSEIGNTENTINQARRELNTSIKDMHMEFRRAKRENNRLLRNANLELIQLVEQGNQVVKLPWNSWQYGINYFYNNWRGVYKGRGDKKEREVFQRKTGAEKYKQSTTGIYGTTELDLLNTMEPKTEISVNASITPKEISIPNISVNLPNISSPSKPILNIAVTPPANVNPVNVNIPTIPSLVINTKASPFTNFSFIHGKIARLYASQNFNGSTLWSGHNGTNYINASGVDNKAGMLSETGIYVNHYMDYASGPDGLSRTAYTSGNSGRPASLIYAAHTAFTNPTDSITLSNAILHMAGNVNVAGKSGLRDEWGVSNGVADNRYDGQIGIHTIGNITLDNIQGYLYGRSNFVSIETWQGGSVFLKGGTKANVSGNENTVFLVYPGGYRAVTSGLSVKKRIEISGTMNVDIPTRNNIIYSVLGASGAVKLDNTGGSVYNLIGANNIVYSGLGYSPNFEKVGRTTITKSGYAGVNMDFTPIINLEGVNSYGDGNVILYFGTEDLKTASPWGIGNRTLWNKSGVGIHQGEISVKASIGKALGLAGTVVQSSESDTEGDTNYVENNVGVLGWSGQRAGITPSTDLGAEKSVTNNNDYNTDTIRALQLNNVDITFGKYSKAGILLASQRGTVMDVKKSGNDKTTIPVNLNVLKDYDTNLSGKISDNNSTNEAATGTVIAYSEGTWDGSHHYNDSMNTAKNSLNGKGSEINIGSDVEISARYYKFQNGNESYPMAYFAKNKGGITVEGNTTAHGSKSIIAYAEDGGIIKTGYDSAAGSYVAGKGDITATDDWAASDMTKSLLFENIGAYAKASNGTVTKIDINGKLVLNGLGAAAIGNSAEVTLRANNNTITTGRNSGLYAVDGGIVNFFGGTITNKDNGTVSGTSDHAEITPFYSGTGGQLKFYSKTANPDNLTTAASAAADANSTIINMTDGIFITGTDTDYSATIDNSSKYQGLRNVTVNINSSDVTLGQFSALDLTWDNKTDASKTFLNALPGIVKFGRVNINSSYKTILTKGKLNITAPAVTIGDVSDRYNSIIMDSELITISSATVVTGDVSKASLDAAKTQGLSMGNGSGGTLATSGFINDGTVNVTGGTAVKGIAGLNVSYGTIINNKNVTVDNGVALYGTNGSILKNEVTGMLVSSGTSGINAGIAGLATYGTAKTYGTDAGAAGKKVDIQNKGKINVNGETGIGIYAENNKNAAQNEVTIASNTTVTEAIDVSNATKQGVGIALIDSNSVKSGGIISVTGTGTSDIKAGKEGIGIYAENSTVNIDSNYGIETKDNGVGLYVTDNSTINSVPGAKLTYTYNGSTAGTGIGIVANTTGTVTNKLNIDLENKGNTGKGIIGIYADGGGILINDAEIKEITTTSESVFGIISKIGTNITNTGKITLGNAASLSKANVAIYSEAANVTTNSGAVTVGDNSIGIYGYSVSDTGTITAGDGSIGIYSNGGNMTLNSKINIRNNKAVGVFIADGTNQTVNSTADIKIGDTSFGYIIGEKSAAGTVTLNVNDIDGTILGNDATYVYSTNKKGEINNFTELTSNGDRNYGLYAAGTVTNYADINFGNGIGNVGIYSINGGTAKNGVAGIPVGSNPVITVSGSNVPLVYGIGMAAGYAGIVSGNIENYGTINVNKDNGIGMYAVGNGSIAKNYGTINLSGKNTVGMYLDNNAVGENHGIITTVPNATNDGIIGVVTLNGAILKNYGTISIESNNGIGVYYSKNGKLEEHGGNITATGTNAKSKETSDRTSAEKSVGGIIIQRIPNPITGVSTSTIIRNGKPVIPIALDTDVPTPAPNYVTVGSTTLNIGSFAPTINSGRGIANVGMYVDTSGVNYTKPIEGLETLKNLKTVDLVFGVEAAKYTNGKDLKVGENIIEPYNTAIKNVSASNPSAKWKISSASLTWIAEATQNADDTLANVYLVKLPYTSFAKESSTYNFMSGLEQKYSQAEGREKDIFNKLNNLGKGEAHIFAQAIDEMMGHQYANTQQRTYGTGRLLDKEISHLAKEWETKSKQSNKIKVFGMRDEYKTDTAGIIDYTSNAYGFAYLHEDETLRLGNSTGWYAGAVHNRFKFKDIGGSKENQTMLKLGVFKSTAFDHNGSLKWTISGEGYVSRNDMHRKYLVVDEIFNAKSDYTTYGAAVKNEISKEIRTSERTSIKPYGSLKLEYGRFTTIKEKTGEMRLEVKGNDYYSVRPEVGVEFKYRQPMAVKTTFVTTLGLGYENELGKVGDVKNKARVRYTDADWFNIRGEKDDRKGNFKADLNIGVENQRFGVTVNAGYDTKGKNVRGGIGFRVIY